MLTQIQIPEPQAALLAACPRPRTSVQRMINPSVINPSPLTPSAPVLTVSSAGLVSTPEVSMSMRWSAGTRGFGFAVVERVERPAGYASAARVNGAGIVGNGTNGNTSSKQDQQHLTDRRGPVTWRPPH
jgi:hypothetical protein